MSEVKKVVLAYSDGLDTSIIIPWLKEHYNNCEVIAVCGNVGQKGELEGLEERAKASGASSTSAMSSESLKVSIRRWQASGFFRISPNSASAFSSLGNIVAIKKTLFLFISSYLL